MSDSMNLLQFAEIRTLVEESIKLVQDRHKCSERDAWLHIRQIFNKKYNDEFEERLKALGFESMTREERDEVMERLNAAL